MPAPEVRDQQDRDHYEQHPEGPEELRHEWKRIFEHQPERRGIGAGSKRRRRRLERPGEVRLRLDGSADLGEAVDRAEAGPVVVDPGLDEPGQLRLAADPADAHPRSALEAQARVGKEALADPDPVRRQVIEQADIAVPVAGDPEDRLEIFADRLDDPLHGPAVAAVGGEFEDEMGLAAGLAGDGVEADEVGSAAVRIETVERGFQFGARRIAEPVDRGVERRDVRVADRGDDRD
jgi:hypothetical protein